MATTTLITGNTYPVRLEIKALGGRWDAEAKGWRVPADRADEARKLVGGSSAASRQAPAARRTSAPAPHRGRNPEPPLAAGEQIVSRPSRGRDDPGYAVGETHHFGPRVRGQGGGPDGRYWTVTWGGKRRIGEEDDTWADRHGTSWACLAHVRPATDAEAAPVAERVAAAQRRDGAQKAIEAAIQALPGQGRGARLPEWTGGLTPVWREPQPAGSLATRDGRLYLTDAGAAYYRSVYDDDPIVRVALAGSPEYEAVRAAVGAVREG